MFQLKQDGTSIIVSCDKIYYTFWVPGSQPSLFTNIFLETRRSFYIASFKQTSGFTAGAVLRSDTESFNIHS